MHKSKQQLEFLDSMIQRLLVVKHDMSLREMRQHLEENNVAVGDLEFLSVRREKVLRRIVSRINRAIRSVQVADYYVTVDQSIEELWKIANSAATPIAQKRQALNDIMKAKRERLMTLTVMDVFSQGDPRGAALGEKTFPVETFDTFIEAVKNNVLRQEAPPFKYLPDVAVIPKAVNQNDKPKTTTAIATTLPVCTGLPLKNDRSFAVAKK